MADTNTDTSAIDEKKGTTTTSTYMQKVKNYLISVIGITLLFLIYFSGGSLILFVCKLAQANIFPTDSNCAPYTDTKPDISPSPLTANIFKPMFSDQSMKIQIPYDVNSKNTLISMLKSYKETPSSHFLANYFIAIFEDMLEFNYASITLIANAMNKTLPEQVIVFLGPIIALILYTLGLLINTIYFVFFSWFPNMKWFFKTNSNKSSEGKPEWSDVSIFSPVNFTIGVWLAFIFGIIGIFGIHMIVIIPMLIYHNTLLSLLFYQGTLNGKKVSAFSIILEALKYYKILVVVILSIIIIALAFSKVGAIAGVGALIAFFLIFWGVVAIDLFVPIPEKHLSALVSYEQATKKCSGGEKHGWLYNTFIGQRGGGNITRQLKKLSEKLKK